MPGPVTQSLRCWELHHDALQGSVPAGYTRNAEKFWGSVCLLFAQQASRRDFLQGQPYCGTAADTSQAGFVGDAVMMCKAKSAEADGNKGGDLPLGPW